MVKNEREIEVYENEKTLALVGSDGSDNGWGKLGVGILSSVSLCYVRRNEMQRELKRVKMKGQQC